jgi:hypothetical protein
MMLRIAKIEIHKAATVPLLALLISGASVAESFVPDDRLVSDPSVDLKDPEFDQLGNLMLWQDTNGDMWLSDVDPVTGDIIPNTGQGLLVDSGLANIVAIGNGPEFGYGAGEVFLCYNKLISSTRYLAIAKQDTEGNWVPTIQEMANDRYRPICTPPGTTDAGRIVYVNASDPLQKAVSWRNIDDAASERTFTTIGDYGGRWADTERAFVTAKEVGGFKQLFWVDIDTDEVTQITFDSTDKFNAFLWHAPEYNDVLMSAAINFTQVGIYRRIDGVWRRFYTYSLPSAFQFISSPEPFVHNGKSFITVIAAKELGSDPLPFLPKGISEVWVTNIDPVNPFFRRINNADVVRRSEPEPIMLPSGPAVYFTQNDTVNGNATLHLADTGLGSPSAGDSDADGVSDDRDGCTVVADAPQIDTDGDGIGNRCDPDFNNDCLVDATDFLAFRSQIGSTTSPLFDLNGDGTVTWVDFFLMMKPYMGLAPGPGATPNVCNAG